MELDSYKVFNGTCLNLILAFVLLVRMFHTGRMEALGLKKHSLKVLLYAPAAGYLLVLAIHFLLDKAGLFQWIEHATNAPAEQSIVSVLRHSSDIPLITVICFSAAIAAPLVEELIFRGYLYPIMKKYTGVHPPGNLRSRTGAAVRIHGQHLDAHHRPLHFQHRHSHQHSVSRHPSSVWNLSPASGRRERMRW